MISLIIMDADGVLINGDKFSDALHRDYDVDLAKEKEFFTTKFQECLVGQADLKEAIGPYLASFGWKGTADELLEYWFKTEHGINEDLMGYIRKLRASGVPVVLATNQEKYRTQYMLEHMGFDGAFDKIYSSAHVGLKKPDTAFYTHIVDDMHASKGQTLLWEDDQRNIDGALASGIKAESYTDYSSFVTTMRDKYQLAI
ncbi:MAG TPA: HAD-IA family hydrolase [Patescibacteria group bacterium]|nr:HAD-IA family hydrolase [Patescibacteria group bacterium]